MKKKLLCGLMSAVLIMGLTFSTAAAPFISSEQIEGPKLQEASIQGAKGEKKDLVVVDNSQLQASEEYVEPTSQEERKEILENQTSSLLLTSLQNTLSSLNNLFNNEVDPGTTVQNLANILVDTGIRAIDAFKTSVISNAVDQSNNTTDLLKQLSDENDLLPKVREAARETVAPLQEANTKSIGTLESALELVKGLGDTENNQINTDALVEAMEKEIGAEEAAILKETIEELQENGHEITPEVLEQVIENKKVLQKTYERIQNGDVDDLLVGALFDLSASPDIRAQLEAGKKVTFRVSVAGVTTKSVVIGMKPQPGGQEINDEQTVGDLEQLDAKDALGALGNKVDTIETTPGDGYVEVEVENLSPILILVCADNTTELFQEETQTTEPEAPVEETMAEPEEASESGSSMLIPVVVVVAIVVVGAVLVLNKKKTSKTDTK